MQKFALVALAVASLAVAHPTRRNDGPQCNTGSIQCCNSVEKPGHLSESTDKLLGLIGVLIGSITADVGIDCSPTTVVGASSNQCTAQPLCCENNNFDGMVSLGCTPINLSL